MNRARKTGDTRWTTRFVAAGAASAVLTTGSVLGWVASRDTTALTSTTAAFPTSVATARSRPVVDEGISPATGGTRVRPAGTSSGVTDGGGARAGTGDHPARGAGVGEGARDTGGDGDGVLPLPGGSGTARPTASAASGSTPSKPSKPSKPADPSVSSAPSAGRATADLTGRQLGQLEQLAREVAAPAGGDVALLSRNASSGQVRVRVTAGENDIEVTAELSDAPEAVHDAQKRCRTDEKVCVTLWEAPTAGIWARDDGHRRSMSLGAGATVRSTLWIRLESYGESASTAQDVTAVWKAVGVTALALRRAAAASGLTSTVGR